MIDKKAFESIYIENYGLSDLELGDAAMIKLFLMGSKSGAEDEDWDQDPEELITDLKTKALDFVENDMEWENKLNAAYVYKWVRKRTATLNEKEYSPGMISFIEAVRTIGSPNPVLRA